MSYLIVGNHLWIQKRIKAGDAKRNMKNKLQISPEPAVDSAFRQRAVHFAIRDKLSAVPRFFLLSLLSLFF